MNDLALLESRAVHKGRPRIKRCVTMLIGLHVARGGFASETTIFGVPRPRGGGSRLRADFHRLSMKFDNNEAPVRRAHLSRRRDSRDFVDAADRTDRARFTRRHTRTR